jgi:hypothetical protein
MVTVPVVLRYPNSVAVRLKVPAGSFNPMVTASEVGCRVMEPAPEFPRVLPRAIWSAVMEMEPPEATVTDPAVVKVEEVEVSPVGVPFVEPIVTSPPPAVRVRAWAPLTAPRVMSLFGSEPVRVIVPPPAPSATLFGMVTPAPAVFTVKVPFKVTVPSL